MGVAVQSATKFGSTSISQGCGVVGLGGGRIGILCSRLYSHFQTCQFGISNIEPRSPSAFLPKHHHLVVHTRTFFIQSPFVAICTKRSQEIKLIYILYCQLTSKQNILWQPQTRTQSEHQWIR